jgi:hypothetical protein
MFRSSSKPGLELHQADDLFVRLGGADQVLHEGAALAGAVERHLDRQHLRVGRRRLDEVLDAGGEALVGHVHQGIAPADNAEDALVFVGEREGNDRRPGLVAQAEDVEVHHRPQVVVVQLCRHLVDVVGGEVELADEEVEHPRIRVRPVLEAHDVGEAALPQLLFHQFEEVFRLLFVTFEVGVARDTERHHIDDRHVGEEVVEVMADHLAEADEPAGGIGRGVADADPLREHLGDFHAGEEVLRRGRGDEGSRPATC